MSFNPHLTFDGQCAEAFRFYEKSLGGKVKLIMTYGESPLAEQTPPHDHGRVLHAALELNGQTLTGADEPSGRYRKPQGLSILLNLDGTEEAEHIFTALATGGEVQMPLAKTFWTERFGMVIDRFGIPWMVNCGAGE